MTAVDADLDLEHIVEMPDNRVFCWSKTLNRLVELHIESIDGEDLPQDVKDHLCGSTEEYCKEMSYDLSDCIRLFDGRFVCKHDLIAFIANALARRG